MTEHLATSGDDTKTGGGGGREQDIGHVRDGRVGNHFFHVFLGDRAQGSIQGTNGG